MQVYIRQFCHWQSATGNSAIGNSATSNPAPDIFQTPHSFIADTNIIKICLDTGANRVIVNDKNLLTNFIPTNDKVKGIGEKPTTVVGTGTFNISLQSDNGIHDKFSEKKALYVPTLPYNIIPPQILLQIMREKSCISHMSQVGEREFLLHYRRKTGVKLITLTVLISLNGLFLFRTSQGYFQLFQSTQKSSPDHWRSFAGNAHVIFNDDYNNGTPPLDPPRHGPASGNPREPPTSGYPREWPSPQNLREHVLMTPAPSAAIPVPNVVPFGDVELEIIPTDSQTELQDVLSTCDDDSSTKLHEPIETDFIITPATVALHDPKIAIEKRKQMRLLTIHESLEHTSFHIIRLLCLAGILPRELASVAYPLCPGCSYGKSNRRPWCRKGKSNLKKIKPVTIPGQVVSVDQLVRYTPGLIPTHRGLQKTKRYLGATIFVDHASDFTMYILWRELQMRKRQ